MGTVVVGAPWTGPKDVFESNALDIDGGPEFFTGFVGDPGNAPMLTPVGVRAISSEVLQTYVKGPPEQWYTVSNATFTYSPSKPEQPDQSPTADFIADVAKDLVDAAQTMMGSFVAAEAVAAGAAVGIGAGLAASIPAGLLVVGGAVAAKTAINVAQMVFTRPAEPKKINASDSKISLVKNPANIPQASSGTTTKSPEKLNNDFIGQSTSEAAQAVRDATLHQIVSELVHYATGAVKSATGDNSFIFNNTGTSGESDLYDILKDALQDFVDPAFKQRSKGSKSNPALDTAEAVADIVDALKDKNKSVESDSIQKIKIVNEECIGIDLCDKTLDAFEAMADKFLPNTLKEFLIMLLPILTELYDQYAENKVTMPRLQEMMEKIFTWKDDDSKSIEAKNNIAETFKKVKIDIYARTTADGEDNE